MRHPRLIRFLQLLRSSAVRHTFIGTLRRLCVASFVGASWLTYLGKDGPAVWSLWIVGLSFLVAGLIASQEG